MFAKSQSINEPSMVIPNTQSKRNAHSKLLLSLLSCAGGPNGAPHKQKEAITGGISLMGLEYHAYENQYQQVAHQAHLSERHAMMTRNLSTLYASAFMQPYPSNDARKVCRQPSITKSNCRRSSAFGSRH